jgi:hypothetical protein
MIRRVAFKKALVGGALGALAWEIVVRILILAGLPLFDVVRVLGTMIFGPQASTWKWWITGMAMHGVVGCVWAVFYAYFFWSFIDIRPVFQGIIFSLLPAFLAGLIMVPQMDLMLNGSHPPMRLFAISLGIVGPFAIVLGHLIYGAVLGSIYVRPVGYPVRKGVLYG